MISANLSFEKRLHSVNAYVTNVAMIDKSNASYLVIVS